MNRMVVNFQSICYKYQTC